MVTTKFCSLNKCHPGKYARAEIFINEIVEEKKKEMRCYADTGYRASPWHGCLLVNALICDYVIVIAVYRRDGHMTTAHEFVDLNIQLAEAYTYCGKIYTHDLIHCNFSHACPLAKLINKIIHKLWHRENQHSINLSLKSRDSNLMVCVF